MLLKIATERGLNPDVRQVTLPDGQVLENIDIPLKEVNSLEVNFYIKRARDTPTTALTRVVSDHKLHLTCRKSLVAQGIDGATMLKQEEYYRRDLQYRGATSIQRLCGTG